MNLLSIAILILAQWTHTNGQWCPQNGKEVCGLVAQHQTGQILLLGWYREECDSFQRITKEPTRFILVNKAGKDWYFYPEMDKGTCVIDGKKEWIYRWDIN